MTKQLKPWDQYRTESNREPLELPLPAIRGEDNEVGVQPPIRITMPSGGVIRAFNRCQRAGDIDGSLVALLGEKDADRLTDALDGEPGTMLTAILQDVMAHFGFGGPGEANASST